ncbi:zinc finger protein JACKDAW [Mercurialis annua]|uniref:zinc finger protein JACKDAW n=1 Tax=Mercurialis annua TaxID=3986 RepID=UPI00215F488A|nr:zinc finger protein JACKDAW [Mercurialis annua]
MQEILKMMPGHHAFTCIPGFAHLDHEQNANPNPNTNSNPATKKKRNLPGTPDPDAEVVALSPKSLMATNRFLCEICNKGFQRDQNLQLHRRGHNLPWKLRQRTNKEIKKKVYICPEKTCVHHDPSRALGDLTGIKKHFSRKHGEKKWKCEKCSKKYAVQSDWKAHSKTCGTREYKCDCGTLFSRKDSFITHRAFCDALIDQESARISSSSPPTTNLNFRNDHQTVANLPHGFQDLAPQFVSNSSFRPDFNPLSNYSSLYTSPSLPEMVQTYGGSSNFGNLSLSGIILPHGLKEEEGGSNNNKAEMITDSLPVPSLYSDDHQNSHRSKIIAPMSATALLQKAAQMGSTRSSSNNNNQFFFGSSKSNELHQVFRNVNNLAATNCTVAMGDDHALMAAAEAVTASSGLDQVVLSGKRNGSVQLNSIESGLTRDFLGMSGQSAGRRPFLPQEMAKLASMSSAMGLSQFTTS